MNDKYDTLKKQIEAAEASAREAREELERLKQEEKEKKPWRPKKGEPYWTLALSGRVYKGVWENLIDERRMYSHGRVFRSRAMAEKVSNRERVLGDMWRIIEKHGGSRVPDYSKRAYRIFRYVAGATWAISDGECSVDVGSPVFPTKAAAQEAIDTLDLNVFLED